MDGWMSGWTDGRMEGQMDQWRDGEGEEGGENLLKIVVLQTEMTSSLTCVRAGVNCVNNYLVLDYRGFFLVQ